MFPQKCRGGLLDLPRASVTRVAGVRKDLRGRFAGIEVGLSVRRETDSAKHRREREPSNLTYLQQQDLQGSKFELLQVYDISPLR